MVGVEEVEEVMEGDEAAAAVRSSPRSAGVSERALVNKKKMKEVRWEQSEMK